MAIVTPQINVTPNEEPKYVTDPELLKQLNSVEPSKSEEYVTDPELLKQLNAPIQSQNPEEFQGIAPAPGDTSIADTLRKYIAEPAAKLTGGEFDEKAPHPTLAATAKGIINLKSAATGNQLEELIHLQEAKKEQYGPNFETAPPKELEVIKQTQADIKRLLNESAQQAADREAISKKYGTDALSKKIDTLYEKPEFQQAGTFGKLQMYGHELLSNPSEIPGYVGHISLESLPSSLAMVASASFARLAGGGPTGAVMAGGATSSFMEFGQEYVNLRQQGFSNEEATAKAATKSGTIGFFDAVSFKSAGQALDKIMTQAEKGLAKRAVATGKEVLKETGKQASLGAAGEGVGSVISGQPVDVRSVAEEALGEVAGAPFEAVTTFKQKTKEAQEAPPAPPAPPAPTTGGGAPPPTTGAINEAEFSPEDLPGAKPPPPPAAPITQVSTELAPEIQAKVNEYSELLQKYDSVAFAKMMRDINDGLIKSEDDLKEYKRSYNEIVEARQKRANLEKEVIQVADSLRGTDDGRLLRIKWDSGQIKSFDDLKPFKDLVKEKSVKNVMQAQMAAKPIEDKAVEEEARSLQAEMQKYSQPLAEGMLSAINSGKIQVSSDLDFYKRRLQEYKTRTGEIESKIKETHGWRSYFDEDEIKEREQILENAPQSIKDKVAKADETIQKITDRVNEAGYSIKHSGNEPDNIRNLQRRVSGIAGSVSAILNNSKAIQKNYKRASPKRLESRISSLEDDVKEGSEDLSQVDTVSMKLNNLLDKEIKSVTQEGRAQEILDQLSDDNIAPKSVADKFWEETYFKLPAETQAYFRKYLNRLTSFKPGSVLAVDRQGNSIIAKDWMEIGKDHAIDLGEKAEDLQGTERGYVALMDEANRRMVEKKEAAPQAETKPVEISKTEEKKPEIGDYVKFKEPVVQYKGTQPFSAEKTIRGKIISIKPNGDLELRSSEGYYTKPLSEVIVEQKETVAQAEEKKPEVKPTGELESFPKDIQDRLKRLHRLATLAERKVMDKPITMDDVVNAYNRAEDAKKEEMIATTEKNLTKEAEDKLLLKIDKEYVNQFQSVPPKKSGLIAAIKNGSLDISKYDWAKDAYDIFKIKEKDIKTTKKPEGASNDVAEQLRKFNASDYRRPEKVRAKPDDAQSKKDAEVQNENNLKVYLDAAKLFLEGPLDAKPENYLDLEGFPEQRIQPQSIEKKSADKAIANAEEQNKVISEILNKKDVRYYLGGIFIDRKNDRMVTTDGHRATILKKPDYSSVPKEPEKLTGSLILKDDGTWIDGQYPDIDRIIPESHAENKVSVSAKELGDYARGIEKANKFLKSEETLNIFLKDPDALGTFNAKFIRQMADLFRRFGYKDFTISLDEGKKLFATSPDGKLSHIIMGMRNNNPMFKAFSKMFRVEKSKGARSDGQTIDSIKDKIVREFGKSVKSLFDNGMIVVVNSVNELDPKYQNELDSNDRAFFDKDAGVAYIIADRVTAGDIRGVVLHEVGEHYGLRGMLGDKVYNEQLENLKKQKNTDITVAKAWEHVLKNYANLLETDEKQFLREVMARIGENAPNHNLWKRFVTAIKTFLLKKGIIKNLSGEELQDLVMRSLHTVTKGRRVLSSGTGIESSRGPTDPDAKRELDDELRANDIPDAPFNNQKDLADKFKDNFNVVRGAMKEAGGAPKQTAIKMISGLDSKLTDLRIKAVFFGAGLEETEAEKYKGKLVDAMGKAVASVGLTNAVHAGHIAANVMHLGKLIFNQGTQMFQAARDAFSMDNVFRLERSLFKKLGKQTATNLINTYFEAKRTRSIQNEFLTREATLLEEEKEGTDPEVAQRNYEAIIKAYKKIPEYFLQKDEEGNIKYVDVLNANKEVIDQVPVINDEIVDDYMKKDREFPELKDMMDNWTKVNHNMLDNMVFAGIISKKRGDHLKSIKDYVPWFRIQDDAEELHAPSTFVAGLTNISKEKTFKRGATTLRIDNIIDNMVHNVMMMTRNSIRNYGALQIAKSYATRKPNGKLAVFPKEGIMPDGAVRTNILVNGKRIIIEIKDPQIAASLLGLENLEIPMVNGLSQASQVLRRGVTSFPLFQAVQVFKDAPTAAAVTGLKSPFKVWAKILGSFFNALNPNDEIVGILKSYGIGGFHSSARTAEKEVELTKGQALMNIGPWILRILDHIGDASDYAQRRIIYQETIKQGGTEMEAIFRANAVIDFMRHGNSKAALALVRTVSFMNAYAQQIDVLGTSMAGGGFKGMERSKARARFLKITGALMASSLLYCMLKGGDDDYDKLDDQAKMRNYIIGDLKIPIGTSYAFFFKAVPEMIYNKIINEGTKNAVDAARLRRALSRAAYDSLLGPNPIATGLKAPVEILLNHDFFTGGTVTPRGMEKLDTYLQYTNTTSNLGKVISHLTLGLLNPIEADHLMRGWFGTAGATGMWASDLFTSDKPEKVWASNPFVGQLFMQPEPRGREDLFYDLKERSDKAYTTWETLNKRRRTADAREWFKDNKALIQTHGYIVNAEAGLKELNAEIRRLSDDPKLTPERKRKLITEYQIKKNRILDNVNRERVKAEK